MYSSGPGFLGWLTLILITLKLLGVITWSWWLVFAPLALGFVLVVALAIIVVLVSADD